MARSRSIRDRRRRPRSSSSSRGRSRARDARRRSDVLRDDDAGALHGGFGLPAGIGYPGGSEPPSAPKDANGQHHERARRDELADQRPSKSDVRDKLNAIKDILSFQPVEVEATIPASGEIADPTQRPPEDFLAEKATKSMAHFKALLSFKPDFEIEGSRETLLGVVVKRCIDLGFGCAQALASASEDEFCATFTKEGGAQPDIRCPGHGRKLALDLHMLSAAMAAEVAQREVQLIRKQAGWPTSSKREHGSSASSVADRWRPRGK